MNVLFELYGKSNRIGVKQSGVLCEEHRHKVRTEVTTVIALLCLAGIAFNVRFAVALRRERRKSAKTHSGKCINLTPNNHSTELREDVFVLQESLAWLDNNGHPQSH